MGATVWTPSIVTSQLEGHRFESLPFKAEVECSPRACVGFLEVLQGPPTALKHPAELPGGWATPRRVRGRYAAVERRRINTNSLSHTTAK